MKTEEQVCNWELAKKLEQLGVKQDSLWYWISHIKYPYDHLLAMKGMRELKKRWYIKHDIELGQIEEVGIENFKSISAFTVCELGWMLPEDIIETLQELSNQDLYFEYCNTEKALYNPDFLAKIVIYLIEKGLWEI